MLATIGRIIKIEEIPGADNIVSATVFCAAGGTWHGVIEKNKFAIDEIVEVYLQDAVVPAEERFSFMEPHKYIVRMKRMRGARSEALIMKLTTNISDIGTDIAEIMNVKKHVKPIPENMSGVLEAPFPNFIPKTDEKNFQAIPHIVCAMNDLSLPFYISQKMDGTSITIYNDGEVRVCSREWQIKRGDNVYWNVVRRTNLEKRLPYGMVIQGEVVGPGIQGNPAGYEERQILAFNVFSFVTSFYHDIGSQNRFLDFIGLQHVPIVEIGRNFNMTDEQMLSLAEEQTYQNGKPAEGIVIRYALGQSTKTERLSFKVLNLKYKR